MTTATGPVEIPAPEERSTSQLRASWVLARRGLWHMRRQPEALADATFQPVVFVLLFAFVFGGAIAAPGGSYREFLMGGIFAQSIVFGGSFGVAVGIASDRKNGATDRFRSLPIGRGVLLAGYAVANLIRAFLPMIVMSVCGLIIGWRIRGGLPDAIAAYALLAFFAFAMIWVGVLLGSILSSPEAVQGVAFVAIFPLTFVASTFVPVDSFPRGLKTVAEWNPVTTLAESLRNLFGNPTTPIGPGDAWSLQHPVLYTVLACAAIIAVCAPLAVRAYVRSTTD
jgi:ABC transporter DrrB family efflux protein